MLNLTPYNMDLITVITAILLGVLEALMRDRLDDFNRHSSSSELNSSKKIDPLYHILILGCQEVYRILWLMFLYHKRAWGG
jgi:hypothetical protein